MGAGGDGDKEIIMTCKFLSWAHCLMVSFTQRISTRMGLGFVVFFWRDMLEMKGGGEVKYKLTFR